MHPVMMSFISPGLIPWSPEAQTRETAAVVGGAAGSRDNPGVPGETFRIERTADRTVKLIGELDLASFDAAMAALEPILADDGDLEFELSDLSFLDSSGIRVLVKCRAALDGRGTIVLRDANAHVTKILEIAGLADLGIRSEDAG
jgi:anti-anti-sigma factor